MFTTKILYADARKKLRSKRQKIFADYFTAKFQNIRDSKDMWSSSSKLDFCRSENFFTNQF